MTVVSISGIRGVFNRDLLASDICAYVRNFARMSKQSEVLVGRDTRSTGPLICKLAISALLGEGRSVVDYGIISTPAIFRESRARKTSAIMVTASHNEPEWNGLKFIVEGRGIDEEGLRGVTARRAGGPSAVPGGRTFRGKSSYDMDLVGSAGERSCDGVRVVLDLNGGAAVGHAPAILSAMGCRLTTLGGVSGVFSRMVDPTDDQLRLLTAAVEEEGAQVGFAFDCDGDRLVLVDDRGRKRTGDYMLTLALMEMLPDAANRSVVVSTDTTMAVDDIVSRLGGTVYRSKVGEANVIAEMLRRGVRLGGEGSSGGLVDADFNYCRDSMVAAIAIAKGIRKRGTKIFDRVPRYSTARVKLAMDRRRAAAVVKRLGKEYPDCDRLDGVKVRPSPHSWVLVRPSGTEDAVRVSAEAISAAEAQRLVDSFAMEIRRLAA